jgi:hypothetical protein
MDSPSVGCTGYLTTRDVYVERNFDPSFVLPFQYTEGENLLADDAMSMSAGFQYTEGENLIAGGLLGI